MLDIKGKTTEENRYSLVNFEFPKDRWIYIIMAIALILHGILS